MLTMLMFLADGTSSIVMIDASQVPLMGFVSALYEQDQVLDVEIISYDNGDTNGYIIADSLLN